MESVSTIDVKNMGRSNIGPSALSKRTEAFMLKMRHKSSMKNISGNDYKFNSLAIIYR